MCPAFVRNVHGLSSSNQKFVPNQRIAKSVIFSQSIEIISSDLYLKKSKITLSDHDQEKRRNPAMQGNIITKLEGDADLLRD